MRGVKAGQLRSIPGRMVGSDRAVLVLVLCPDDLIGGWWNTLEWEDHTLDCISHIRGEMWLSCTDLLSDSEEET